MIRRATISLGSPPPLLLLAALDVEAVSAASRNNVEDDDTELALVEGDMTKASDLNIIIVTIKASNTAIPLAGLEVVVDCRRCSIVIRGCRQKREWN